MERIRLPDDEAAILEDIERVREVGVLPAHVAGDATARGVACCDGTQHGVVEGGIPDLSFFSE